MTLHRENATRRPSWGRPSTVALSFLAWSIAIPALFADRLLNTDGDLASHLFLGRKVLQHGIVVPVDWTFTRPGAVFVAYEWLSEAILAGVEATLGLPGAVALATVLIAGSVALATAYLSRRVEPFLALPAAMLIAVLTAAHWSARPHLFSFACLSALLWVGTRRRRWRAPAVLVLFALWANLHPAFLYGVAVYLAYLVGDAIDERRLARWRANAVAAGAAALGTVVNPLGWRLHAAVLGHLADRQAFRMVDEFLAPSLTTVAGALFYLVLATLVVLAMLVVLAVAARAAPSWKILLPVALATAAAVVSARNVPLFALFGLPLALRPLLERVSAGAPSFAAQLRSRLQADEMKAVTTSWIGLASVCLTVAAIVSSRGVVRVLPDRFSADVFPTAAVAHARTAGLTGTRLFHEYTWGGYILYAWPHQPIYIDGMANLFGSALMREYAAIHTGSEGWDRLLRARAIDGLLLDPGAPLVRQARASAEWTVAHETETALLLTRREP